MAAPLPRQPLVLRLDEALYGIERREADAESYRSLDPVHSHALVEAAYPLLLEEAFHRRYHGRRFR